ncbi:hypothetical protein KIF59_16440 [Enterobacter cloacae subsp. cloacae]|nr:hypothetical protein [Enterobacter cloacae subsp. cloacae]
MQNEFAQDNATYLQLLLKLKPTTGLLKATNNKITLSDSSLTTTNMFRPTNPCVVQLQSSELTELNKPMVLTVVSRIELPKDKSQDKIYINHIITELDAKSERRFVYPKPSWYLLG